MRNLGTPTEIFTGNGVSLRNIAPLLSFFVTALYIHTWNKRKSIMGEIENGVLLQSIKFKTETPTLGESR